MCVCVCVQRIKHKWIYGKYISSSIFVSRNYSSLKFNKLVLANRSNNNNNRANFLANSVYKYTDTVMNNTMREHRYHGHVASDKIIQEKCERSKSNRKSPRTNQAKRIYKKIRSRSASVFTRTVPHRRRTHKLHTERQNEHKPKLIRKSVSLSIILFLF